MGSPSKVTNSAPDLRQLIGHARREPGQTQVAAGLSDRDRAVAVFHCRRVDLSPRLGCFTQLGQLPL